MLLNDFLDMNQHVLCCVALQKDEPCKKRKKDVVPSPDYPTPPSSSSPPSSSPPSFSSPPESSSSSDLAYFAYQQRNQILREQLAYQRQREFVIGMENNLNEYLMACRRPKVFRFS